jgi:DNA-binding XRE family transcriptional regulator
LKSRGKSSIVDKRLLSQVANKDARLPKRHQGSSKQESRVKKLRFELGLSRVELAKLALVSEKTIDRVEAGTHTLRETTCRKVFNALNKIRSREGLSILNYDSLFSPTGIARKKGPRA